MDNRKQKLIQALKDERLLFVKRCVAISYNVLQLNDVALIMQKDYK